jgi:hypothetical protein
MGKNWNRDTRLAPYVGGTNADEAYHLSHAPKFNNAEQYIKAKLIMLVKDFRINPTKKEIEHLYELATESEINRAVRQIINDHWG